LKAEQNGDATAELAVEEPGQKKRPKSRKRSGRQRERLKRLLKLLLLRIRLRRKTRPKPVEIQRRRSPRRIIATDLRSGNEKLRERSLVRKGERLQGLFASLAICPSAQRKSLYKNTSHPSSPSPSAFSPKRKSPQSPRAALSSNSRGMII